MLNHDETLYTEFDIVTHLWTYPNIANNCTLLATKAIKKPSWNVLVVQTVSNTWNNEVQSSLRVQLVLMNWDKTVLYSSLLSLFGEINNAIYDLQNKDKVIWVVRNNMFQDNDENWVLFIISDYSITYVV